MLRRNIERGSLRAPRVLCQGGHEGTKNFRGAHPPRRSGRGRDAPMTDVEPTAAPPVVKKGINLALQGGGAHGAFTWGVLDYLLEDGRLAIEGISGASAGALNAVMVADGLARGGP